MAGINLPNNDVLIQKYQAIADEEFAKGSKADTSKLLAALEAVNVFYHGNISAVHRVSQRERAHKANENHEELVESHKNLKAKILQAAGGAIGVVGTCVLSAAAIGGTAAGVPFAGIKIVIDWSNHILTAATGASSALTGAAQSGDQAKQTLYSHAVENQKNERNDDQSTNQAIDGQKNEAMRRKKEVQQQEGAAWSAAVSSLR